MEEFSDFIGEETPSAGELRQVETTASVDFDQKRSVLRDGNVHRLIPHGLEYGRASMGHLQNAIPHRNGFAKQGLAGFRMDPVIRRSQVVLGPDR